MDRPSNNVVIAATSSGSRRCSRNSSANRWAEQPRPPVPHRNPRKQFVAAIGADDQEPQLGQSPGELGQHLQGKVVGPVQVLQGQQGRTIVGQAGDQVGQLQHQQPTPAVRVPPAQRALGQRRRDGRPHLTVYRSRRTRELVGQVEEQAARQFQVSGKDCRPDDAHPLLARPPQRSSGAAGSSRCPPRRPGRAARPHRPEPGRADDVRARADPPARTGQSSPASVLVQSRRLPHQL